MKRYLLFVICSLFFVGLFSYFNPSLSFADSDEHMNYKEYGANGYGIHDDEDEDEALEEVGELVGWGTIVFAGAAGIIFPLRKVSPFLMRNFSKHKKSIASFLRLVGKFHILVGVLVLLFGSVHGVMMFLHEGELGAREIIGIGSIGLFLIAAINGFILRKNKSLHSIRKIHLVLIGIAGLLAVLHVAIS